MFTLLLFVVHIELTRIRQESANKWYCNTVKGLLLPNTVNQKDDTVIPHIKIKITEMLLENKLNTLNPHVPLLSSCCSHL